MALLCIYKHFSCLRFTFALSQLSKLSCSQCSQEKITKVNDKAGDKRKRSNKAKNELNEEIALLFDRYSKTVWNRCKQRQEYYVADKNAARDIALVISENDKDVLTYEANPGPGVLTESLLSCGLTNLCVFESEEAFIQNLKLLSDIHEGRLSVVEKNVLEKLSDLYHLSSKIEKVPWKEGISLKFILTVNSTRSLDFMRHALSKLSTTSSIFTSGRCQIFALMCEQEFHYLTAKPRENYESYRNSTVLYNLFFDVDYLKKFSTDLFLPRYRPSTKQSSQSSHFHLMRLTPKTNLLELVTPQRKLSELYFFINHHMTKKKEPVIKSLEQWIPFCGPKFIKNGMNVFTRFKDLNPTQIFHLFQQFSSLAEYENSPFRAAARQTYERSEQRVIKT